MLFQAQKERRPSWLIACTRYRTTCRGETRVTVAPTETAFTSQPLQNIPYLPNYGEQQKTENHRALFRLGLGPSRRVGKGPGLMLECPRSQSLHRGQLHPNAPPSKPSSGPCSPNSLPANMQDLPAQRPALTRLLSGNRPLDPAGFPQLPDKSRGWRAPEAPLFFSASSLSPNR